MQKVAQVIVQGKDQSSTVIGYKLLSIRSRHPRIQAEALYEVHRQNLTRFIQMLHQPDRRISYALRTVIHPLDDKTKPGEVEIFLLAKLRDISPGGLSEFAYSLKLLLSGSFSGFEWQQITDEQLLEQALNPVDWDKASVAEIRRRIDAISVQELVPKNAVGFLPETNTKEIEAETLFYVRPFSMTSGGFERLIRTMLSSRQTLVMTALLTPTVLTQEERQLLNHQVSVCEQLPTDTLEEQGLSKLRLAGIVEGLLRQQQAWETKPYLLSFSAVSSGTVDPILLEYISSTLSSGTVNSPRTGGNAFDRIGGGSEIALPGDEAAKDSWLQAVRGLEHAVAHDGTSSQERLGLLADSAESVCAFYFPVNAQDNLPGIGSFAIDEVPLPKELIALGNSPEPKLLIGKNYFYEQGHDVFLSEDTRRQHAYIVGQTGTGKTTLLKTMILADMQAGRGLTVIDPHGEMYHDLLGMIPESRKNDVVLLDPADLEFPIGLNLLEVSGDAEREYIVKEMRAILKRYIREYFALDSGEYAGPVFFQHVQNNMLLATSDKDRPGTIVEFANIFQAEYFWKRWLPLKWKNAVLENWVEEGLPNNNYSARTREGSRMGDFFSSKFADFTNDPRLSLIFGQPRSTINLHEIVRQNKILLVNLSKGMIGEANASMLGMILMAKISSALMERVKILAKGQKPEPYYLYVDEFQNLATENFSILLSEARKFGLGLILANQYLNQIKDHNIMNAVFGNVGTLITFRLGAEDAKVMESQFQPNFGFNELCNLPNYQALLRTNIAGERVQPYTMRTIPLGIQDGSLPRNAVVLRSRERYGTPRNLAEFLVLSSLHEKRDPIGEVFIERRGTPKSERLIHIPLNRILESEFFKEDTRKKARWEISTKVKLVVVETLMEAGTSRKVISKVLDILDGFNIPDQISNEADYLKFLGALRIKRFDPQVRVVVNAIKKEYFETWLKTLSRLVSDPDKADSFHEAWKLFNTSQWMSAYRSAEVGQAFTDLEPLSDKPEVVLFEHNFPDF